MERQEKNTQTSEEYQDTSQQVEEEAVELENNVSNTEQITEDLTRQIDVLQDKLLRQMAESDNIRTRSTKLVDEAREYAIFGFTKDLIPVMDNLSRALEHLPEHLDNDVKNVVEGIKMTKKEFESVFDRHLLESIAPQPGDKFDYHSHHAISQVVTDEYKPGTIVETMQVGYRIKDRLIRPAAVTVAKSS
jgi:molecular chaperone GrpE